MVNALIIGTGNTGRIVIDNLIKCKNVKKICLYNRRKFKAEHIKEEISPLSPDKEIIILQENFPNKFLDIDLIFICASDYRSDQRAEDLNKRDGNNFRIAELEQNKNVIKSIAKILLNIKGAKIFVISNPVDIFTNYLASQLDQSNEIYGFGLALDILRIKHILRRKGLGENKIQSLTCLGNHGEPIPVLSRLFPSPKSQLYEQIQSELQEHFINASFAGVTYFQWSNTLSDLVLGCAAEKDFLTGLSMMTSWKGFKDFHIGIPVEFMSSEIKKRKFQMSDYEERMLTSQITILKENLKRF
jgi:malate/lactate dehydrogenase